MAAVPVLRAPEHPTGGARVIIGSDLGEVLERLLEDHHTGAAVPYFLVAGYKAPGVWVDRKTQHWVSGTVTSTSGLPGSGGASTTQLQESWAT